MKVEYIDHMGDDLRVANCARVSHGIWRDVFVWGDTLGCDDYLIKHLAKEDHISPFFHPQITLRLAAPFAIANQAKRHQVGFAVNEESRRYRDHDPEFYKIDVWRERPPKSIKQGSGEPVPDSAQSKAADVMRKLEQLCLETYHELLELNIAPEQARMVFTQSTMTQWIWTGSLFAYARLCRQRLDHHAQQEIQGLAAQIAGIVEPLFPVSWKALLDDH